MVIFYFLFFLWTTAAAAARYLCYVGCGLLCLATKKL